MPPGADGLVGADESNVEAGVGESVGEMCSTDKGDTAGCEC